MPGARRRNQPEEEPQDIEIDAASEDEELEDPEQTLLHLFIHSFLARRITTHQVGEIIYNKCASLCGVANPDSFVDFLAASVTPALNCAGLDIVRRQDQATGNEILVLVNNADDDTSKLATEYKPEEIAFFRLVVEKIMTADNMSYRVTYSDALRCASNEAVKPPITKVSAVGLLTSFVANGWLDQHTNRSYALSSRSLVELAKYLKDTFAENEDEELSPQERPYVDCKKCFTLVTLGVACPNAECDVRLHRHCAEAELKVSKGLCPGPCTMGQVGCYEQWDPKADDFGAIVVGSLDHVAVRDDSSDVGTQARRKSQGKKKSQPKAASKKSRTAATSDDEDDEDELEEDDEEDEVEEVRKKVGELASKQRRASNLIDDEAGGEDEDMYD